QRQNHVDADAILDACERIEELQLQQHIGLDAFCLTQATHANQWRVAHRFNDAVVNASASRSVEASGGHCSLVVHVVTVCFARGRSARLPGRRLSDASVTGSPRTLPRTRPCGPASTPPRPGAKVGPLSTASDGRAPWVWP